MEIEKEDIVSDLDGEVNDASEMELKEIYNKNSFINSRGARLIRIMSEFTGVQDALKDEGIFFSLVVFGSARALSKEKYELKKRSLEKKLEIFNDKIKSNVKLVDEEMDKYNCIKTKLEDLEKLKWTIEYYDKVYELSKKLTLFFNSDEGQQAVCNISSQLPKVHDFFRTNKEEENPKIYVVATCTGGGPGYMEAANRGSKDAGGKSMGFLISLPYEKATNPYVDKALAFKFHYFFTRKFWLIYLSLAFIILPGGFGTLDEMMEILTLKQCNKFKRDLPIVLMGKQFWHDILNFQKLVDYGVISQKDLDCIFITDCVDEAYNYVISHLINTPSLPHMTNKL